MSQKVSWEAWKHGEADNRNSLAYNKEHFTDLIFSDGPRWEAGKHGNKGNTNEQATKNL